MTKMLSYPTLSIGDVLFNQQSITYHNQGIDTLRFTTTYHIASKFLANEGLTPFTPQKNSPVSQTIQSILTAFNKDSSTRYKRDQFPPIVEVVKLSTDKGLSNYMIIIRNIPLLFDLAKHHKTPKDKYCLIVFAGLHQPTKSINSEAIKIISKIRKRRSFKLQSFDLAIDTTDPQAINEVNQATFRDNLMPLSEHGVIREGSTYYLNDIKDHGAMSRIAYYDKYQKQTQYHKQGGISNDLRAWKRLEVTLTFDVTQPKPKSFAQYIESYDFIEELERVDEVARLANIEGFDRDYLLYQLNSLIDNRFLNNRESQKQFNSVEALERFKSSDFRRYILPV